MGKTPVLKAKFTVPEIPPGVLYCDRIRDLGIAEARAAVINAPAGYGKTTAVLLSLQQDRAYIHWYRMEKEDAALPVFFAHLMESLFGISAQDTDAYRSLSSIGNIIEEYSLLGAVLCQDAWSLYADSKQTRYLVFDDFHHAAGNAAICEMIRYLISNLPPCLHLLVLSRTDPGISAEKLALSGELVFLDGERLLFSKEEIESIYSGIDEPAARAKYAEEAFAYTEGWIAGVALMQHVRESREGPDVKGFRDDRQNVFRYLVGEVFAGAEREMLRRAARISLFDEFIRDDLVEVFRMGDAEETIAWLERNNFYIQKVNTAPPSYRFHSLFRDALRQVFADEHSPEEIRALHLTAAVHFGKTGRYTAAIRHYLFAEDEGSAVCLAAEKGLVCMDNGDIQAAAELMRALPERLVFDNAILLCILGGSLSSTETERGFAYLLKAITLAVKNGELDFAIKVQGFAISVCVQQNQFQNIKGVIDMVPMPQAMMVSKQARTMLVHSLFLKSTMSFQIPLAKALRHFVDRINRKEQVELWQYSSLLSKASLYGVIGDLRDAEQIIRQLTEHPVALRNDRWRAFGLQLSGFLSAILGEGDGVRRAAEELTSQGLMYADGFRSSYGAYYAALEKYMSRDTAGAVATAEEAERLFLENKNLSMAVFDGILRMAWQAEGEAEGKYASRMEEQVTRLASLGGNDSFLAAAHALTGARYLCEGVLGKAEDLLEQSWKWAKRKQALQSQCGLAIHLSALHGKKGDLRREKKYLAFFGETAEKEGYVYFREMTFPALVRACARCVEYGITPRHMAAIIGKYFGFEAVDSLLKEAAGISSDPDAFIRRFPPATKPGIACVEVKFFGAFALTVDGKPIAAELFKTRKIIGIFKHILANPEQNLSREKLAAAFWPDSDAKAAANSLRVALYELRKAMAALDMAFEGESALIAEDKNGFHVCRPAVVVSDAARFTALHTRLRTGKLAPEEEIAVLREMTALYDGDYLEDSDAEDCAITRAHYRSIYVEASYRLAVHYRAAGDNSLAEALMLKHLQIDPFDERVCGLLIDLYRQTGQNRQADSLRRQFTQYFEKEMGVRPEI